MSLFTRSKYKAVLGYDLGKPRMTLAGWVLLLMFVGLPVMGLGALADFLTQIFTGRCIGVWCLFG